MTAKTIPRHARPLARQRRVPRPNAGTPPSTAAGMPPSPTASGTAPPQLAEERARTDPLAGPVAITERAVLGDTMRWPTAWCEMPGCISWHDHPAALGEADIRARALAAGWYRDAVGRLVCPSCQQRNPDLWIAHRLARQRRPPTGGIGHGAGHTRPGRLRGMWTAVAARARDFAGAPDRRLRWPHLLAASNGWNTPPPVLARSAPSPRHRTGPTGTGRLAGRQAAATSPATRDGDDHRHNQEQLRQ